MKLMALLLTLGLLLVACGSDGDETGASSDDAVWSLPGEEVFPEGVATDPAGGSFYVGSTRDGAVYRGDVDAPGTMEVFLEPGADGRTTVTGLEVDDAGRLFVAGRDSNRFFVYDTSDGGLLAAFTPPRAERTLLNDVAVTSDAAYITDSFRPVLFRVPLDGGEVGELEPWLDLDDTVVGYEAGFNLNGIVASDDGSTLLTVQYNTGDLFRIDTASGGVGQVDLGGAALPGGDGLVLDGSVLHVVLGGRSEVVTLQLDDELGSGEVVARTADDAWRAPTTIAAAGDLLLLVNSQLNMAGADGRPTLPFTVTAVTTPDLDPDSDRA